MGIIQYCVGRNKNFKNQKYMIFIKSKYFIYSSKASFKSKVTHLYITSASINDCTSLIDTISQFQEIKPVNITLSINDIDSLSLKEEFCSNLARYSSYFITVMLGTVYIMIRPVFKMFNEPISAFLTLIAIVSIVYISIFTINSMLGITNSIDFYSQNGYY